MKKIALLTAFLLMAATFAEARFTHPGIVAYRGGEWAGSDHLLNLTNQISIEVEVSQPEKGAVEVDTQALKEKIAKIFEEGGIIPQAAPPAGQPDLPLFHVLIMVYPIKDGYSFIVTGRLFEAINNPRIILDEGVTMQAITWDTHSINIASTDKFKEELNKAVEETAETFVDRYKFFESVKTQQ